MCFLTNIKKIETTFENRNLFEYVETTFPKHRPIYLLTLYTYVEKPNRLDDWEIFYII